MLETRILIINKLGLHARAAAKLVSTASSYGCKIKIAHNGKEVDGKSIMSVMMLAACKGSEITVKADGDDTEQAIQAITDLINNRFDEAE